jgi:putative DNA primase/helicase
MPAIVAFNAGNLMPVAQTYRQRDQDRPIYIAGDNDHRREAEGKPNVGREKAEEAAVAAAGFALLPVFAEQDAGSDWNDLAHSAGHAVARQQILAAIAVAEREQMMQSRGPDHDRDNDRGQSHGFAREHQMRTVDAGLER